MYSFGENLKKICKEKDISPQQLADKLDVSYSAVGQWLSGKRVPKGKTARRIIRELPDTHVTDLMNQFPWNRKMESFFEDIIKFLDKESDRIGMMQGVDILHGQLDADYDDAVERLKEWLVFFDNTYNEIISYMIAKPYPSGYPAVRVTADDDDSEGSDAETNDRDAGHSHKARDRVAQDGIDNIVRGMLRSMRLDQKNDGICQLLEGIAPSFAEMLYDIVMQALKSDYISQVQEDAPMLALYRQLNPNGKKMVMQRLGELTQMPAYTNPVETVAADR